MHHEGPQQISIWGRFNSQLTCDLKVAFCFAIFIWSLAHLFSFVQHPAYQIPPLMTLSCWLQDGFNPIIDGWNEDDESPIIVGYAPSAPRRSQQEHAFCKSTIFFVRKWVVLVQACVKTAMLRALIDAKIDYRIVCVIWANVLIHNCNFFLKHHIWPRVLVDWKCLN